MLDSNKSVRGWSVPPKSEALRSWMDIMPASGISPIGGYINPYAIIDYLTEQFNKQPLSYTTDPITGQITATKTMEKPELPKEMSAYPHLQSYFQKPLKSSYIASPFTGGTPDRAVASRSPTGVGTGWNFGFSPQQTAPKAAEQPNLAASWILPKGALSAPAVNVRSVPSSDYERTMGENLGIGNFGVTQNIATVNPQSYWPKSAFKIPMASPMPGVEGARPTPQFGGAVNYATGKWFMPPGGITNRIETYGKFSPKLRTSPSVQSYAPLDISALGGGQARIAALKARTSKKKKTDYIV